MSVTTFQNESSTRPAAAGGFAAFREGFAVPREGFVYLCRNPGLWRYAVIPILLNVLITAIVLGLLVGAAVYFAVQIHPRFARGWGWRAMEVLAAVAMLAAAAGLAMAAWVVLNGVLCGYYNGKLARQVELRLGLPPDQIREVPLRQEVADAFRNLGALIVINGGFLLLNVVPVLGSVVATVGSLYFDCYIFGRDYLDLPLALRGIRRADKLAFCRRHRGHTVGLGAAVLLFNFVPLIGAVPLSTAAAGAVLLHRRLQGAALPPSAAPPGLPDLGAAGGRA